MQLLELARWAPSADNGQPWRVCRADDELRVLSQHSTSDLLDTDHQASNIALGAFVESCRLAAGASGLGAGLELHPERGASCATLGLARRRIGSAEPLAAQLTRRVSHRRPFDPRSCTDAQLERLQAAVASTEGVGVHLVEARHWQSIAEAAAHTEVVRIRHKACHAELHDKLRWSDAHARRDPTGLDVKTLELKAIERLALRATRSYRVLRAFDLAFRIAHVAGSYSRRLVLRSGAIAILHADSCTPLALMRVGIALQRLWLAATAQGLSTHVIATPLLLRCFEADKTNLTPRDLRHLRAATASWDATPKSPPVSRAVLMLRLGRGGQPSARSQRLPAERLLALT